MPNTLRVLHNNQVSTINYGTTNLTSLNNDYRSQTMSIPADTEISVGTSVNLVGKIAIVVVLSKSVNTTTTVVCDNTYEKSLTSNIDLNYGKGGGGYIVFYLDLTTPKSLFKLVFNQDTQVSKILVGNYWTPNFNTGYGSQIGYEDTDTHERMQNGDLYVIPGNRHKNLSLELPFMDKTDRTNLLQLVRTIGKSKPIFISVFPEDVDTDKEQDYSIYGYFVNLANITNTTFITYTSSIQLEEI